MRILITGGAGFIGSAVIRQYINETEHKIINLDALAYTGNLESLAEISDSPRYHFEHADICDVKAVERIFNQYQLDTIMYLEAESKGSKNIKATARFQH